MTFHYLASPYSHPERSTRDARAKEVRRYAAACLNAGLIVMSPIAMTHEMAEDHQLPFDFPFWERFNRSFLGSSRSLIVALMPGWRQSKGVAAEIEIAKEMCLPIRYASIADDGRLILSEVVCDHE